VKVNAAAVVSAVQAYAKINAQGQWIDRSETVNLSKLFDRMTRDELEAYARGRNAARMVPRAIAARGEARCSVTP
jgi:hypothetical protein